MTFTLRNKVLLHHRPDDYSATQLLDTQGGHTV